MNRSLHNQNVEPFIVFLTPNMEERLSDGDHDHWAALLELIEEEIQAGTA